MKSQLVSKKVVVLDSSTTTSTHTHTHTSGKESSSLRFLGHNPQVASGSFHWWHNSKKTIKIKLIKIKLTN